MNENKLRWIVYFLIIAILCSMVVFVLNTSLVFPDVFYTVYGYTVTNAFILVAGYAVLQKLKTLAFWRFSVYLVFAAAGSVCVTLLLPAGELKISPFSTSAGFLFFTLGIFAILASFNFALSRIIFTLSIRESCLFGVFIGLINMLMIISIFYR